MTEQDQTEAVLFLELALGHMMEENPRNPRLAMWQRKTLCDEIATFLQKTHPAAHRPLGTGPTFGETFAAFYEGIFG